MKHIIYPSGHTGTHHHSELAAAVCIAIPFPFRSRLAKRMTFTSSLPAASIWCRRPEETLLCSGFHSIREMWKWANLISAATLIFFNKCKTQRRVNSICHDQTKNWVLNCWLPKIPIQVNLCRWPLLLSPPSQWPALNYTRR